MMRATSSPESVLVGVGGASPENWVSSSPPGSGRKKKAAEGDQGQRMKMKFLVRLRSLTKSDSGRRGVCLTCPHS
ncbi:AAA-ATPase [Prunus yedoensis var. nudiflora]|uniref:AAA-ATPase n=1 Tax=Prunus yedoensis var. nudiflora TaxID=2094558 RepID=A0A314YGS4_PRUYE|nr:AAA-ATPase [Prunus yedoensis var. nudiflora]